MATFQGIQRQEVKGHAGREPVIGFGDGKAAGLQLPLCQPAQCDVDRDIEAGLVRKFNAVSHRPVFVPDADQVVPALALQMGQVAGVSAAAERTLRPRAFAL